MMPTTPVPPIHVEENDACRKSQPPHAPVPVASEQRERKWFLPCAILSCALFLYLETFILPWTPWASTGDQSIYLHDAARMFDGQMIYKDFAHFTFPGTSVLYLGLFKVFGVRAWIPRAMLILIGTLIAWLSFGICGKLMKGPSAFLPGFLFLTLPFTGDLDATHRWYSTLAATAALAVLMERRTRSRLAWAGLLLGLGTWFTQSLVLSLVGLALFVAWEERRERSRPALQLKNQAAMWVSYLGTVLALNAYFVWKVGFRQFCYNTVVFVAKYYRADGFNSWRAYLGARPSLRPWVNLPQVPAWVLIHLLLPLMYVLLFARYWQKSRLDSRVPWERLMLINTVGFSMFLMVASAASYSRLCTVSLPALILLVWFLDSPSKIEQALLHGLWATVLLLAVIKPAIMQTRWSESIDLPTGRSAFFNPEFYQKATWMIARTRPSDYFFGDPSLGFVFRLQNPGRVAFVRPTDYTRPEEVSDLVRGLEDHQVKFVSWYAGLDDKLAVPQKDHLGPLRQYLREHYRVATKFSSGDEIWERNP
jgi:hypothetical protein